MVDQNHIDILKNALQSKQEVNPRYSLRSFAKKLGIHPGTISSILSGKRAMNEDQANVIVKTLSLKEKQKKAFLRSVRRVFIKLNIQQTPEEKYPTNTKIIAENAYYHVIAEWEHYAILSLLNLKCFDSSVSWISLRLGIDEKRTRKVLENLLICELIEQSEGKIVRRYDCIASSIDVKSDALIESHSEILDMAKEKLLTVPLSKRGYFSETMAIDVDKLDEAKDLIRDFKDKLATFLEKENATEVYNLGIQLFPLTKVDE